MPLSKIKTNSVADEVFESGSNLIINGGMTISQRGSSFSYAHDGTTAAYNLDRFNFGMRTTADEYDCTVAQVSDAPDGFSNSLKITTGTAESAIGADEYYILYQPLEAQNLQLLGYGTSSAKAMTLSFYVKSSLTGTFASSFYQADDNRILNKTYTINSADTWERKTISIPADTTGVIDNDNGGGMYVYWGFGTGSDFDGGTTATTWAAYTTTNFFDSSGSDALITTAGATWQLTGVQMEVGEQATPFQHEDYAVTLHKCRRYYQINYASWYGVAAASGYFESDAITYNPPVRANPTVAQVSFNSGSGGRFTVTGATSSTIDGTLIYSSPTSAGGNSGWNANWSADAEI